MTRHTVTVCHVVTVHDAIGDTETAIDGRKFHIVSRNLHKYMFGFCLL